MVAKGVQSFGHNGPWHAGKLSNCQNLHQIITNICLFSVENFSKIAQTIFE